MRPPGRVAGQGRWVPGLVFVVAVVCGTGLSANLAAGHSIPVFDWKAYWLLGLWTAAWVVAVVAAFRLPGKVCLVLVLVAAAALRLAALTGSPTTSDDLYRYAWDGRVQLAGTDPYAQPPTSAALVRFHESWLWPDRAGCAALGRPPGCTRINRSTVRTIYPPLAEAWFTAVYRLGGIGARHKSWQIAGLVTDLATVGLLIVALRRWGVDERWAALYALCPFSVFEIVNNAHVDGLAIAFVVAAAAVAIEPQRPPPPADQSSDPTPALAGTPGSSDASPAPARRPAAATSPGGWTFRMTESWRDVAVGVLLGGATMVKIYPAILLVALIGLPRSRPWRSALRATAAAAIVVVVGYLPHVVSVGLRVIGYLPGYLKEEQYRGGGRFLIAGLLRLPGSVTTALAVAALVSAVTWVLWRRPSFPQGASLLLAALFLTATPVQPWYALTLLAVGSLTAWPWWSVVAVAGEPYYFGIILAYRHSVGLGRATYAAALGVLVVAGQITRLMKASSAVDVPPANVGLGGAPDQRPKSERNPTVRAGSG